MNDDDALIEALGSTGMVDPVVEIMLVNGNTVLARQVDALAVVRDLSTKGYCKMRTAEFDHITVFTHGVAAVRGRQISPDDGWVR